MIKKENTALNILMLLIDHSTKQNPLKQKDIAALLESRYNYKPDRQTIRRGIDELIQSDFPIEYHEPEDVKRNYITNIWFNHDALLLRAGARIEELEEPEPLAACLDCAYFDDGSCSCFEKESICCPYLEEEEGD